MKSIKISEKADLIVLDFSQKFRMSKQALVCMVLENLTMNDIRALQDRELVDNITDTNYMDVEQKFPDEEDYELDFEIGEDEVEGTLEFEEDYKEIEKQIKL